jgi:serine/threonine protein kinase
VGPADYEAIAGTERETPAARVFLVQRAGVVFVCKRLGTRVLREPWAWERLDAEAALLRALAGRGAPRLVDAGRDGHGPYFVMQFLKWPALATRTGRLDPPSATAAARAAFTALALVHGADHAGQPLDVVHADLSPSNVLVADRATDAPAAAIVDFGLARFRGSPDTPPGPFRGTLAYAAPELARGEPFDARADLHALAASLLHVLSSEAPRTHAAEPRMLVAAAEEAITPWAERASAGLAGPVRAALIACCAFDATRRPSCAAAVAAAL